MNSINNAYINALLADASYVEELSNGLMGKFLFERLTPRMTIVQAQFIADNFSIVSTIDLEDKFFDSGFDATLWKGNSGTAYEGKHYLSLRGTQGTADLVADTDLATNTVARHQIQEMVNWWMRITTPMNQMATQVNYSTLSTRFWAANPVHGTGEVVGVQSLFTRGSYRVHAEDRAHD